MELSKVYIIEDQSGFDERAMEIISGYIPPARKERAARYRRLIDRNNCILVYFLLMYGLLKDFGMEEVPAIYVGEYGKPSFLRSDICFSMSHSDTGVCCGIARCNIGADIQDTNIHYEDMTNLVMSDREKEIILSSRTPQAEFARFWTLKESLLKYRGIGINDDLKSIDMSKLIGTEPVYEGIFFRSEKSEKLCVSACAENGTPVFIRRSVDEYIDDFILMKNSVRLQPNH